MTLLTWIVVYFLVGVPIFIFSMTESDTYREQARGQLTAIFWPVAVPFWLVYGIVKGFIWMLSNAFGKEER